MTRCIIAIIGCLLTGLTACSGDSPVQPDTAVELRVLNATPWPFTGCKVASSGPLFNYGDLQVGAYSGYHGFPQAYRYGYVELLMNSKTYVLQPTDYVGETPLAKGRYTYKITHTAADDNIHISLVKE